MMCSCGLSLDRSVLVKPSLRPIDLVHKLCKRKRLSVAVPVKPRRLDAGQRTPTDCCLLTSQALSTISNIPNLSPLVARDVYVVFSPRVSPKAWCPPPGL